MRPHTRPSWFFKRAQYGGILCDIASHQADQFLYFTGSRQADVVFSQIGNVHHPQYPAFEDFGDLVLRGEQTLVFSVVAALVLAFAFAPLRTRVQRAIDRIYGRMLGWSLNHRFVVLLVAVLAAWVASLRITTILPFVTAAFSLAASATYVFNDLWDLDSDRAHPRKKNRPLASSPVDRDERK